MSDESVRPALSQAAPPSTSASSPDLAAPRGPSKAIIWALLLALVGLGITLWHFLSASPLAFTAFMILGQPAFGVAMALDGWVIFHDLRRRKVL